MQVSGSFSKVLPGLPLFCLGHAHGLPRNRCMPSAVRRHSLAAAQGQERQECVPVPAAPPPRPGRAGVSGGAGLLAVGLGGWEGLGGVWPCCCCAACSTWGGAPPVRCASTVAPTSHNVHWRLPVPRPCLRSAWSGGPSALPASWCPRIGRAWWILTSRVSGAVLLIIPVLVILLGRAAAGRGGPGHLE